MRFLTQCFAVVAIALLWACSLWAQSDSTIHRDVEAVDIEAQQNRRTAMPVQMMSAVEIQRVGAQNVADVVRHFGGTTVKDYGGVGGLKTVSVRGMGAAHTAVSYDGVVVSDCQAGPIDVGRFNIDNVETVKLAVGQTDDLLQPARAFASAAILSIVGKRFGFDERKTRFDVGAKCGSFGAADARIAVAHKLTDRTAVSANADFMRADGEYRFTIPNREHPIRERRINSDIRSAFAELNLTTDDSSRFRNHLKAYGFYSERGLPGAVIFYNPTANERLWDKNFFVQDDGRWRLRDNLIVRLQAKYNYSWNRYEDRNVMYTNGLRTDLNTQHEGYLSVAGMYSLRFLSFSLAGDAAYNTLKSNMMGNPQPRRLTLLSVANARFSAQHMAATATLVATHITENVEFGSHPDDINRLSPAFSFKLFTRFAVFRAILKETFRVPTFNELYYTTLGTTGLKPEIAREVNVGCNLGTDDFFVSADFYANHIENKIVAIPTLYVWKMANYGEVEILGADIAVNKDAQFGDFQLKATANYSYQRALDVTDKNSKLYKSQIPYTPRHSGNVSASLIYNKITLSLSSFISSKRYFLEYNIKDNEIEPYAELSATLSRSFRIGQNTLSARFSCINLTDKQYCVVQYYPMPGRNYQLQVNFTL